MANIILIGIVILGIADVVPNNGIIAFVSRRRDGNDEIYIMDMRLGNQFNITGHGAADQEASWSPDGNQIAFASNRDGNLEIYIMNFDGSNVRRITNNDVPDFSPAWSPNGEMIVFVRQGAGFTQSLHVMDTEGNRLRHLLDEAESPRWLSDDTLYTYSWDDGPTIFVFEGDEIITYFGQLSEFEHNSDPVWEAMTNRVAFSQHTDGEYQIYLANEDGSNVTQLTDLDADFNKAPDWSPDGEKLVFTSHIGSDTTADLYIIDEDGNNLRLIAQDVNTPAWRP